MKTLALALLVLAACSSKSDKADTKQGEAAAPTCDVIAQAYGRLPSGNPQMATIRTKLTEVMTKRCTEDKWPASVLQCYEKASTQPAMKACRDSLPPELNQKATADVMSVMGGAGGGGMPHGAAPPAGSGQ